MASELNMYEAQVAEHKMDIERLSRELQEVKKKYYLQKKKEHLQKYISVIKIILIIVLQRKRSCSGSWVGSTHSSSKQGRHAEVHRWWLQLEAKRNSCLKHQVAMKFIILSIPLMYHNNDAILELKLYAHEGVVTRLWQGCNNVSSTTTTIEHFISMDSC